MDRVQVAQDNLVFCAAHFMIFPKGSEPLHGHNYRVSVTLEGELRDDMVMDFIALKRLVKALVEELDHRVLLPAEHPRLRLRIEEDQVETELDHKRYVFPMEDVRILPIPNTSAEWLARYLAGRLRAHLPEGLRLHAMEVEVEESFGQRAIHREALHAAASTP
ncbi:MAG: 6-pyruvoyl tetrahydropterin synthase family protein [Thermoflexus sp.]|jgi:6-pyruvoyltetrahydropterin/6-carboxytetrahydropterin synthase|nr:6-pyruvoyl tetrahydropterin synthase family protein [Thermoflexus sp.]